ncbi:MAG: hypothetical protein R2728_04415 [Chitinophagales bacterium]
MWKAFRCFIFAIAIITAVPLTAQESTAYSRFGLGLLSENNFMASRAMGGLGASFQSSESVNFANPASYARLNLISFEGAFTGGFNRVSSNFGGGTTGNVNLSYLAFSLPVMKDRWVSSIGLVPFSQKEYLVSDTLSLSDNSVVGNIFEGTGTLYTIYWGNGFRHKDFSIGFNIGYLFGAIDATSLSVPLDDDGFTDPYSFTTIERNKLKASGFLWNVGAQYSIPLKEVEFDKNQFKRLKLEVGLAFNSSYKIGNNSTVESSKYSIYSISIPTKDEGESYTDFIDNLLQITAEAEAANVSGVDVDTFLAPTVQNVGLKMPMNLNGGFTFVKTVRDITFWKAGFDVKWTPWSNYSGFESGEGGQLADSWRIAFGGEIFPLGGGRQELRSKTFSQLKYRAGFYYSRTSVTVQNTAINEFGINFGIAIPIRLRMVNEDGYYGYRKVHPFSLGFEVGSRGTKENDLIKDNFVRINLGISLNDKWFVKRKYN